MAQQRIDITLGFQADTAQAKTQIEQLQQSLSKLTATSGTVQNNGNLLGLDPKSISEANLQIAQLQTALKGAFNTKTEKLDLGLFQNSLKQAGLSVQDLSKTFASLGPQGVETFTQLSKTIASAEAPVIRLGNGVRSFMTTLANSARYMVATRALNTMAGTIMNALNYAKDLDKSLNNIAIVTGASSEKMAEFAAQANKAAQRLSVTTTGYTDAALIYYQQGLSDQEVAKRTETTMKMSNVTGESAQEVSSYMTAIWNNFYDGSQSIEEFADKITALGAATASSSQEIANGLQQFAAVANTVGLSYDYAASALATIVAQTRQSESTVGNGLRTLFSRMQGLKLDGETEDGVTLNKYSQALADVGVNALDASGQLRDMDDILSDLGSKWETLSKAQQVALAQTVGGVRQYTTLVALMDNWGEFQENLSVAQGAEGTLQRQQEIYERSWEASRKRVQAAAQSIYQDIIDDKFFIGLNDLFANFLKGVNQVIKGLGGVKGILAAVAAVATTVFGDKMASRVDRFVLSLKNLYDPSRVEKQQQQWLQAFQDNFAGGGTTPFDEMTSGYATEALKSQLNLKSQILKISQNLTEEERATVEMLYKQAEAAQDNIIKETNRLQIIKKRNDSDYDFSAGLKGMVKTEAGQDLGLTEGALSSENIDRLRQSLASVGATRSAISEVFSFAENSSGLEDFLSKLDRFKEAVGEDSRLSKEFKEVIAEIGNGQYANLDAVKEKLIDIRNSLSTEAFQDDDQIVSPEFAEDKLLKLFFRIDPGDISGVTKRVYQKLDAEMKQNGIQFDSVVAGKTSEKGTQNAINEITQRTRTFGDAAADFARNASSMAMQITSVRSALASLGDSDVSNWEKIVRVLTALGTLSGPHGILTQFYKNFKTFKAATAIKPEDFQKIQSQMAELELLKATSVTKPTFNNGLVPDAYKNFLDPKTASFNFVNSKGESKDFLDAEGNFTSSFNGKIGSLKRYNSLSAEDQRLFDMHKMLSGMGNEDRLNLKNQVEEYQNLLKVAEEDSPEATKRIEELRKSINAIGKEHGIENLADQGEEALEGLGSSAMTTGQALWKAFGPMIKMAAVIGVVIVTIYALKKAYEAWYATTFDGRIDAYGQQIANITTEIENLNTSINKVNTGLGNLKTITEETLSLQEKLKTLSEGSVEYQQTAREINSSITDYLKENNLEMNDQTVTFDVKTGTYSLNEKEIEDILNERGENLEYQKFYLEARKQSLVEEQNYLKAAKDLDDANGVYRDQNGEWTNGKISNQNQVINNRQREETIDAYRQILNSSYGSVEAVNKVIQDARSEMKNAPTALEAGEIRDATIQALQNAGIGADLATYLFDKGDATTLFSGMDDIDSHLLISQEEQQYLALGRTAAQKNGYDLTDFTSEELIELGKQLSNIDNLDFSSFEVGDIIGSDKYFKASKEYTKAEEVKNLATGVSLFGKEEEGFEDWFKYFIEPLGLWKLGDTKGTVVNLKDGTVSKLSELTDETFQAWADAYAAGLADRAFDWDQYSDKKRQSTLFQEKSDWIGEQKTQVRNELGLNDDPEAWAFIEKSAKETAAAWRQIVSTKYSNEALEALALDLELAKEGMQELETQSESWWKSIEKGGEKGAKALKSLSDTIIKTVGLQDDFNALNIDITETFGNYLEKEGKADAQAAAQGDTEALQRLRKEAVQEGYSALLKKNNRFNLSEKDRKALVEDFSSLQKQIQDTLDAGGIVLGDNTTIGDNFYGALDAIVSSSATSMAQVNSILGSLNLDAADFDIVPEEISSKTSYSLTYKDPGGEEQTLTGEGVSTGTVYHVVPAGAKKDFANKKMDDAKSRGGMQGAVEMAKATAMGSDNYVYSSSEIQELNQYVKDNASKYLQETSLLDNLQLPPGAGGNGSGGGGGGSGSGGKEREQKAYEDEIERYHYLLKTIDAVNKKYDELENAREKAYGTNEIEVMDKEIENLQQQIGLQKQYLDAISQDYLSDRAAIAAYGAQFDENGNIINYEEIYRRQIDLVNSAAGDDEAADKAYEQFKKVLEQYEKTNELLQDTKLSYQELLDKAAELNLEKITVSVEYNVAISDRDREYLEWLADNMGEGIDRTADKIANLSKQMETYARDAQTYGEGIDAIFEQVGIDGALEKIINGELTEAQLENLGLTKQQIEQIQDYTDKLRETQQAEKELAESAVEELTNAFSEWNEELTDSIDKVTSLNDFLEKYRDILGLLNEDLIGSTKALNEEIDAAERQNNIRAIDAQQQRFAQAQRNLQMLNDAYQTALNNGDTITANALEDSIKEAEDAVQEAHQDMLEATSNALDALEKQWEASLERISKEYAQAMTGMGDISYFEDAYNRQKEMSDWYLDDYEKYYNLNKLVSRINKDLGSDDALVVSGKLNGLLGKINGSLAEGAQISEATVGYYEKELDLIEAQMALEAARNAKSEVRMVRDNEGNMSYVYTANAEEVEKAQDDYQEKWYELMNYTTEQQDELQEKMISSMQDFIDRATEAAEKFGIGTDAFNEELAKIQQDFTATFGFLGSEAENAFAMMTNAKNNWWQDMTDTLKRPIASESDFITSFGDSILGQMMGIPFTEDWMNLMNSGVNSTLSSIYQNGQQYVQNQEQVLNAAGSSLDSIVNDTSVAVQENQTMASEEMDKLNQKITEAQPALDSAGAALENFSSLWGSQMSNLTEGTSKATSALNDFYEALSKVENISSGNSFFSVDSLMNKNGKSIADVASAASQNALSGGYTSSLSGVDFSSALQNSYMAPELSAMNVSAMLSQIPNGTLDQNIHVEAVFPNVVSHREIELAFNNIPLAAQQYANRKQ